MQPRMLAHAYFSAWLKLHQAPRGIIAQWQHWHWRATVHQAAGRVPMYWLLWQGCETHKGAPKRVPIVRKDDVREVISTLRARAIDRTYEQCGQWKHTSGSTGAPLPFFRNLPEWDRAPNRFVTGIQYRSLWWAGWPFQHLQYRQPVIHVRFTDIPHPARHCLPVRRVLDHDVRPEDFSEYPTVLEGFPSMLWELSQALTCRRLRPPIQAVITYGEQLSSSLRRALASAYASPVFDRYGLEEVGVIGTECQEHNGFHINSESFWVEIVDEFGSPVPAGREGRIVVTSFLNYAMPFIRYDTGDVGYITESPCACGVTSSRLFVRGRRHAVLEFAGQRVHSGEIEHAMQDLHAEVRQFQVARENSNTALVYYVPRNDVLFERAAVERRILERLRPILRGVRITTRHASGTVLSGGQRPKAQGVLGTPDSDSAICPSERLPHSWSGRRT